MVFEEIELILQIHKNIYLIDFLKTFGRSKPFPGSGSGLLIEFEPGDSINRNPQDSWTDISLKSSFGTTLSTVSAALFVHST